jgi:hypothetical protein
MSRFKEVFGVSVSDDENQFLWAYFECMIWAVFPESANLGQADLDPKYAREQTIQALAFYLKNEPFISSENLEQAGHDLWLTRCGHGSGFWNRGDLYVMQENGIDYADLLTERADELGPDSPEFIQSSLIREGVENDY